MIKNKNIFKLLLSFSFLTLPSMSSAKLICEGASLHKSAWGYSNSNRNIFTGNLSEPRNANLSKAQKKEKVLKRIKRYHNGLPTITADNLAELVVWAADCTGNDISYLSAIIEHESFYCKDRYNEGGGDSGCGQFTSAPINVFKNQMRLAGQQTNNNASRQANTDFREMIGSCYSRLEGTSLAGGQTAATMANNFISLYGNSSSHIRRKLRSGDYMHTDILSTAIFLKFMTAKAGGYIVPGSAPGGLALYHSGPHKSYASQVNGIARQTNFTCVEDDYTPSVSETVCEMDSNPDLCEFELSPFLDDNGVNL